MFLSFISIFLIIIPSWVAGRDCEASDGYIRDRRDNVTDNCDYECGGVQCGDVCINGGAGKHCFCEDKMLSNIANENCEMAIAISSSRADSASKSGPVL